MSARRRSSCSAVAVSRVLLVLAEVGGGGCSVAGVSSGVGVGEEGLRVNCVIRALSSKSRAGRSSLGKRMWRVIRRAFWLAVKFLRGLVGASFGGC